MYSFRILILVIRNLVLLMLKFVSLFSICNINKIDSIDLHMIKDYPWMEIPAHFCSLYLLMTISSNYFLVQSYLHSKQSICLRNFLVMIPEI